MNYLYNTFVRARCVVSGRVSRRIAFRWVASRGVASCRVGFFLVVSRRVKSRRVASCRVASSDRESTSHFSYDIICFASVLALIGNKIKV